MYEQTGRDDRNPEIPRRTGLFGNGMEDEIRPDPRIKRYNPRRRHMDI